MARAPRRCSGKPTCENRITHQRYCDDCTPTHGWTGRSHAATNPEHKPWRTEVLRRDKGICQLKYDGCTTRATEADHIINIKAGGTYDLENGQAACTHCHKIKTRKESIAGKIRRKT